MGRPVRVLHVIDHLGPGGAQRQLVELACHLDRRRFEVHLCGLSTDRLEFAVPLREQQIPLRLIPQHGTVDLQALRELLRHMRSLRPDIVQTWLFTADLYGRVAAWLAGVRAVVSSVRSVELDKRLRHVWSDRLLSTITDRFIVNARVVGERLHQREWVRPGRIVTIYNGVDHEALAPDPRREPPAVRWRWGPADRIVGFIGRLTSEKRPDLFLEAAARVRERLPDARFVMVGSGGQSALRSRVAELGLGDAVEIEGFRSPIGPVLHDLDLLVSSSDFEGCSNTILEAMAAGVPVVATDVGGNRELLQGEVGWLVPPGNAALLAGAIELALSDPAARRARAAAGLERARGEFTVGTMVRHHERLYDELAGSERE